MTFIGSDGRRHASQSQAALWCILTASSLDFDEEYELPDGRRIDFVVRDAGRKPRYIIESKPSGGGFTGELISALRQAEGYRMAFADANVRALVMVGPELFCGMKTYEPVMQAKNLDGTMMAERRYVMFTFSVGEIEVSATRCNGAAWNLVMAKARRLYDCLFKTSVDAQIRERHAIMAPISKAGDKATRLIADLEAEVKTKTAAIDALYAKADAEAAKLREDVKRATEDVFAARRFMALMRER